MSYKKNVVVSIYYCPTTVDEVEENSFCMEYTNGTDQIFYSDSSFQVMMLEFVKTMLFINRDKEFVVCINFDSIHDVVFVKNMTTSLKCESLPHYLQEKFLEYISDLQQAA